MAVSKMTEKGNRVILDGDDPCIINKKSGEKTATRREGNVFVTDFWVKIPAPPGIPQAARRPRATPAGRAKPTAMEVDYLLSPPSGSTGRPESSGQALQQKVRFAEDDWSPQAPFTRQAW